MKRLLETIILSAALSVGACSKQRVREPFSELTQAHNFEIMHTNHYTTNIGTNLCKKKDEKLSNFAVISEMAKNYLIINKGKNSEDSRVYNKLAEFMRINAEISLFYTGEHHERGGFTPERYNQIKELSEDFMQKYGDKELNKLVVQGNDFADWVKKLYIIGKESKSILKSKKDITSILESIDKDTEKFKGTIWHDEAKDAFVRCSYYIAKNFHYHGKIAEANLVCDYIINKHKDSRWVSEAQLRKAKIARDDLDNFYYGGLLNNFDKETHEKLKDNAIKQYMELKTEREFIIDDTKKVADPTTIAIEQEYR